MSACIITQTPSITPIIIVGGGLTGLITSLTLAEQGYGVSLIAKHEGNKPSPKEDSPSLRTITLNPRSINLLDRLGLCQWLAENNRPLNPITTLAVDDDTHQCVNASDNSLEWHAGSSDTVATALGFVIRESDLRAAAWGQVISHRMIDVHHGITVTAFESAAPDHHHSAASLTDSNGEKWYARLILACDGAQSRLRAMARITTFARKPGQTALIADLTLERPHNHTAWQCFMAGGPIALMPLENPRLASMVWTLPDAKAATLLHCDRNQFNQTLGDAICSPFGILSLASRRLSKGLHLHHTPKPWGERIVLLGDAAHAIHPLAGQGFNLSIGDSIALGAALAWAEHHGGDIGAAATLKRFAHSRRLEVIAMTAATDGLNHLFSFAPRPLRKTASLAMGVFDRLPLKKLAQEFASGGHPCRDFNPHSSP